MSGRAITGLLRLPPQTTEYTVHRRVRVPMRDGVELLADHYEPATSNPAGTLLARGPYGRGWPFARLYAGAYASRGYHVVFQSVRGTFGSGGEFTPMVNEITDGADTAVWLRDQPWFTGSFATIGLSYLGFTQWALLTDPPPEMEAAVIAVGPHDFNASSWGTGSFSLNDFLGWSDMVAHQEDPGRVRALVRQVRSRHGVAQAANGLPLGESTRALLADGAPWFESWLEHPDASDEFWAPLDAAKALENSEVPVLLIGGWQDTFLEQTLAQYQRLAGRGVRTALTVGSWTHSNLMAKAAPTVLRETLDWLHTHLGDDGAAADRSPVRIEINHHGWIDLPDWPPTMPERVLYLRPGGRLGDAAPPADAPPSTFTYGPKDPTPTIGGRLLSPEGGYRKDSKLSLRADVLTFTADPLHSDLYVVGTPVIELAHSSDNPHNDVFVRISEVDSKGQSRNVSEAFRRLTIDSGTLRMELDAVAHRFRAGSRIRVLIAGGSHPRFVRNLGTDEPVITGRELHPARHTIHLGEGASRLVLPADAQPPS